MLREICKKTGIQMLLKEYDFENKKHTTFSDEDILSIFPIVKSITPRATDATTIFELAQTRLQSGKLLIIAAFQRKGGIPVPNE